jgi:hypothetical protein
VKEAAGDLQASSPVAFDIDLHAAGDARESFLEHANYRFGKFFLRRFNKVNGESLALC